MKYLLELVHDLALLGFVFVGGFVVGSVVAILVGVVIS
jgi:hypothetical protein